MGVLAAIGNGLKAIAAAFGWAQQRDQEKNTVDQRTNAEAAQLQADRDRARKEIAQGDTDAINRDVSP